jgi:hypothetical protein
MKILPFRLHGNIKNETVFLYEFFSGNPVPIAVPKKFAVSVEELLGRQQNISIICILLLVLKI